MSSKCITTGISEIYAILMKNSILVEMWSAGLQFSLVKTFLHF